jgi:hypothetical protein
LRRHHRFFLMLMALLAGACSNAFQNAGTPEEAIEIARIAAGFPKSDLTDIGTTTMNNSPWGDLPVKKYQDDQGRIFFVEPKSNTVVEIDARALLNDVHGESNVQPLSEAELSSRAAEIVQAIISDFESIKSQLRYEQGEKVDVYFYSWYGQIAEGAFMPPFIQVGLTDTGELFAYYNTVTLGK